MMTMTEVYHLALLLMLLLGAMCWRSAGPLTVFVKTLFCAVFAWGAFVAAIDWVQP